MIKESNLATIITFASLDGVALEEGTKKAIDGLHNSEKDFQPHLGLLFLAAHSALEAGVSPHSTKTFLQLAIVQARPMDENSMRTFVKDAPPMTHALTKGQILESLEEAHNGKPSERAYHTLLHLSLLELFKSDLPLDQIAADLKRGADKLIEVRNSAA